MPASDDRLSTSDHHQDGAVTWPLPVTSHCQTQPLACPWTHQSQALSSHICLDRGLICSTTSITSGPEGLVPSHAATIAFHTEARSSVASTEPAQGRLDSVAQHHSPPFLPRLQGLLTLFAESFASFNHSTCALSVPWLYASLRGIHLALQTAVPSHSTPGCQRSASRMA